VGAGGQGRGGPAILLLPQDKHLSNQFTCGCRGKMQFGNCSQRCPYLPEARAEAIRVEAQEPSILWTQCTQAAQGGLWFNSEMCPVWGPQNE